MGKQFSTLQTIFKTSLKPLVSSLAGGLCLGVVGLSAVPPALAQDEMHRLSNRNL